MTPVFAVSGIPWFDLFLVAVIVAAAVGGLRRGFAVEFLRYLGLLAGLLVGAWAATRIGLLLSEHDSVQRMLVTIAVFFFVTMLGQTLGLKVGTSLRETNEGQLARNADAAGGALIAGLVCLVVLWLVGSTLDNGPVPSVARAISGSSVLRAIDGHAPAPPGAVTEVKRLFNQSVFPEAFAELRPPAANGPPPPDANTPGIRRAAASTVRVEARGCGGIVFGSGFPVGDGLYVTNAHVVAGTGNQVVKAPDGSRTSAVVVAFDPVRDLAVLAGRRLDRLPPLAVRDRVPNGTIGAVIGYPGGGAQQTLPARVVDRQTAVGRDIYSRDLASRQIYVLRAQVRKGDSGGPLVDRDGKLLGVVFAASTADDQEGYALTNGELAQVLDVAQRNPGRAQVDVGQCAS